MAVKRKRGPWYIHLAEQRPHVASLFPSPYVLNSSVLCVCSSLLEQKEDLRKRLSYTTHKLELLQSEFDSTRQYLETELRRAQEELDKFTDKLRRWTHPSWITTCFTLIILWILERKRMTLQQILLLKCSCQCSKSSRCLCWLNLFGLCKRKKVMLQLEQESHFGMHVT